MNEDMKPPAPATAQPSAAKSPKEYAALVAGMATGETTVKKKKLKDLTDVEINALLTTKLEGVERIRERPPEQPQSPWAKEIANTLRDYLDPEKQRMIADAQAASDELMESMAEIAEKAALSDTPPTPEQQKAAFKLLFGEHVGFGGEPALSDRAKKNLEKLGFTDVEKFNGHTFGKSLSQLDREASEKANAKAPKPVLGRCPHCGYAGRGKLVFYAGEKFDCPGRGCGLIGVIAEPVAPDGTTPEMVENPWMKAERLEKELAKEKKHSEVLMTGNKKLCDVVDDLSKKLHELVTARPEMLAKANHDMSVCIVELKRDLDAAKQQVSRLANELATKAMVAKQDDEARVKALNEAAQTVAQQVHIIAVLRETGDHAVKLAEQVRAKDFELTEMSESLDLASDEANSCRHRAEKAERDLAELKNRVEQANRALAEEHACVIAWKVKTDAAEAKLDEFEEMNVNLTDQNLRIASDLRDAESRVKELEETIDNLRTDYDQANEAFGRCNTIAQDRAQSLIKLSEELSIVKQQLKARDSECEYLIKSQAAAEDYAKNASAKLAEMEEKFEQGIHQEHNILEKAMANARSEIFDLHKQVENLTYAQAFENDLLKARAACARLRQQAEGLQAKLTNTVKDCDFWRDLYEQAEKTLEQVAEERNRYSVAVADARQEAEANLKSFRFACLMWLIQFLVWLFQFLAYLNK